jgi:hypothetical protein
MLTNFSHETLTLPKSTVLGVAEEVSEELVDRINKPEQTSLKSPTRPRRKRKNEALYNKLLGGKLDHSRPEERQIIEPVLQKFAHVLHDETNNFKSTNVIEHQILLDEPRPIRRPQYKTPFALKDEMKAQVENMLAKGVIRESSSTWSAPAILVPKKSSDGKPKFRFCFDFRALNAVTKFDSYPLPKFEETTSVLHGSKYFSILDCYSGFWQVPINEEHRERTGFIVPFGHYEFNRLPFGLSNSPSNFQRLMDVVLRNLIVVQCYVFIDDIIFSKSAEHAARLENVLERFDKANLRLHPGKCAIAQPQVNYLRYGLSENEVSASADKVKAVKIYPTPRSPKEVRAFLGLASFYRRLVPNFDEAAKHLTKLTRKNEVFVWGPCQREAFENLKTKLCTTPVLAYRNFHLTFILTTDASKVAFAAILSQEQDGTECPIAYTSRQMNNPEQAYFASESEMLALVWATKYFICYLFGAKFVVRTDHAALTYLKNFDDNSSRFMRWSLKLSELDFTVDHKPGINIAHVDALSRHLGAAMGGGTLGQESVLREQAKDKFCAKIKPGKYFSKCEIFRDDVGLVYRRQPNDKHQLLVPQTLVHDVIRENNNPASWCKTNL